MDGLGAEEVDGAARLREAVVVGAEAAAAKVRLLFVRASGGKDREGGREGFRGMAHQDPGKGAPPTCEKRVPKTSSVLLRSTVSTSDMLRTSTTCTRSCRGRQHKMRAAAADAKKKKKKTADTGARFGAPSCRRP